MIADLWNAPKPEGNATGTNTIGSSEACMLGGMAMKWRWRKRMQEMGKPTDKPNFVCGPVQVCWQKFARYWDVEIREIPMEPDRFLMTPKEMLERVDENTIGVVPTFGVTYTGSYEFPEAFQDALDKLQKSKGLDIDIHVDAASGGFLTILRPGHRVGFSPAAGQVDQFFRPQIRTRTAGMRLGDMA